MAEIGGVGTAIAMEKDGQVMRLQRNPFHFILSLPSLGCHYIVDKPNLVCPTEIIPKQLRGYATNLV
jgi:hypothetical protein